MLGSGDYAFSFSGLKTAVRYLLPKIAAAGEGGGMDAAGRLTPGLLADVCASFQEAVVEVLVRKTMGAAAAMNRRIVAVSGGVSMNTRLRERFAEACAVEGKELLIAAPALCTDNAAMIAAVAALALEAGRMSLLSEDINPNLMLAFEGVAV